MTYMSVKKSLKGWRDKVRESMKETAESSKVLEERTEAKIAANHCK